MFAEGAGEAVEQWLQRIEGDSAATGLDEDLGRHSRNNSKSTQFGDSLIQHANLGGVVWLVGAFIEQPISRDMRYSTLEQRHAALIVSQQMHIRAQAWTDHIDVLRP